MSIKVTIAGVDKTAILSRTSPMHWSATMTERGPADITLRILAGDSYLPAIGAAVRIYENLMRGSPAVPTDVCVFAGRVSTAEQTWQGDAGVKEIAVTCVSLWAVLDEIRISPARTYSNVTAGAIVTDLVNTAPAGLPIALGTVEDGPLIASWVLTAKTRLSDAIRQLATDAGMATDIDPEPATPELYFRTPFTVSASTFGDEMLRDQVQLSTERSDFRDRQIIQASFSAFSPSIEVFAGDGHTTMFTLRNPLDHLVKATLTTSTRATATGIYTGQPSPGDTITVNSLEYTFVSTLDNTKFGQVKIGASADASFQNFIDALNATMSLAGSTYSLPTWENSLCNSGPLDTTNNQFTIYVKQPGAVGSNLPVTENCSNFDWYAGSTTTPGPPPAPPTPSTDDPLAIAQLILTNITGAGAVFQIGDKSYSLVNALTGTPNQIRAVATSIEDELQAIIDAINGNPLKAGVTYSSSTTANNQVRAGVVHPYGVYSGNVYNAWAYCDIIQIAPTVTNMDPVYDPPPPTAPPYPICFLEITPTAAGATDTTTPATTTADSTGTGTTADPEAQVSCAAGSDLIIAGTPPAAGTSLVVSYYRIGADLIAVENSTLVASRASAESSTGRVDQFLDDNQNPNAFDALTKAQAALAAFSDFPSTITFVTDSGAGLLPGMLLPFSVSFPSGLGTQINSLDWQIQSISGTWTPLTALDTAPWGHFRYSITATTVAFKSTPLDTWERLALTGGSQVGTSGPALATGPTGNGNGGGNGDSLQPVEEVPIGPIDGVNTIFTLTWVPRIFPLPEHQLLRLERNGVLQSPFAEGSPAIGPNYTISENVITYEVPLREGDTHVAFYFRGVGVPTPGTIGSTATISVVTECSKSPSSGAQHATATGVFSPIGGGSPVLNDGGSGSSGWSKRTDSASWSFGGGSLPSLSGVNFNLQFGQSLLSNGPPNATLRLWDLYLDFAYANLDPSKPGITVRYRPTTVTRTDDGSQCSITDYTASPVPKAIYVCSHTSGLSEQGNLVFGGWELSQQF